MSKKIRFYAIDVPFKFESINECNKMIKSLIEFIRYHTRKHGYFCQGMIAASNISSWNLIGIKKVETGKKGRPKTIPVTFNEFDDIGKNPIVLKLSDREGQPTNTTPHIHMIFIMYPSSTLSLKIKEYIDQNWRANNIIDDYADGVAFRKIDNINIGYCEYIFNQSTNIKFINENHSKHFADFPIDKYNFRNLYNAYRNYQDLWHKSIDKFDDKKLKKSELKYLEIKSFYDEFSKTVIKVQKNSE
ncbi:hypothetical protein [Erysipelothrix aquatica]|uniref:hypothetical protein n=1 Tax=Erysipelothrix aquatica TaxID=2683714 RepID=UPI00135A7C60|nr:hypothetical protein [Erysipelothrix aquatica]